VDYKKSEDFAKASARGKKSHGKKEHDHHLGRGGYAFAIPKWRKMEEDLLAQGTIPAVVDCPERVKKLYYAHGGTSNYEDGTLDYPPSLREAALEILKIIEDVRAGRVKVDREIDELTWRSRILNTQDVAGASRWYHGNLPSWETLPPIKAAEEEESAKRRNDGKS
jgi:hypothetical protein